jgi:hypothetical protein
MEHICTWIYLDSPEESSEYPQVGKKSHLPDFQAVYWRCVAVFFALSKQFNPDKRHLLFSNLLPEAFPTVDGVDLKRFLSDLDVQVLTLPLHWQTPEGYFGKWRNQFYIFDILTFLEKNAQSAPAPPAPGSEPCYLILDSDCIINGSLGPLFAEIRQHGLMALPMPYDAAHDINGISRRDMRRLYAELDGQDPGTDPVYYGGEVFAASLPLIRQINAIAPKVWDNMLERHRGKQPKLNEEAHFLSYCYHKIGRFGHLEGFVKRIWTAPHHNNVRPEDTQLPIWHLPSEKTGGIALIFRQMREQAGKRWTKTELGACLGVPKRLRFLDWKHFLKYTTWYKWWKNVFRSSNH